MFKVVGSVAIRLIVSLTFAFVLWSCSLFWLLLLFVLFRKHFISLKE